MAVDVTTRVPPLVEELIPRVRRARDSAVAWMLARIGPDGDPVGHEDVNAYYRVPWTLAQAGERETAAAVLSWIERHALTADGDLAPGPARECVAERWSSYPLAIIAVGAWHLERYDTALAIMRTLRTFQDPATGGAYGQRPELRTTSRQDLFPTAQLGMAALTTGQWEVAAAAYRWLAALYAAQPALPDRLYTGWDAHGLITDVEGDTLAFELITDFRKPRQAFYNPGIAAAFLARYFMVTGDERAVQLGRDYLRLSAEGTERQFDHTESAQICKFGWGLANMLEADPGGGYLDNLVRMGEWFLAAQLPDGSWHNSPFLVPQPTDADDLGVTAEFALHLGTLLTSLGGIGRRRVGATSVDADMSHSA